MKLNLGCGSKILEGYTNVDKFDYYKPDTVHDLEVTPYPFKENSVDEILMSHVLEHIGQDPNIFNNIIKELYRIYQYVKNRFMDNLIPLLGIYVANDHPNSATSRRKPGDGMIIEASHDHLIDLKNSLIIGDSINDIQAGKDLGMDTILVLTGHGSQTVLDYPELKPNAIVSNLKEAADWILK